MGHAADARSVSFGFYHQKFGVVRAGTSVYGYCGGIDINPNRLDDARHLAHGLHRFPVASATRYGADQTVVRQEPPLREC